MDRFFPDVKPIQYGGPNARGWNFRHYDPNRVIGGKTMRDHLRFAVCFWHTIRGTGADPFGPGCHNRPWSQTDMSMEAHKDRAEAMFEFTSKLGAPFYCFHDRDVAPEGRDLQESHDNLDAITEDLARLQKATGIRLLWGTANLFSNPRYNQGAGTSPFLDVFTFAAAQVRKAMEVTHRLGGEGYVFWGGREGYMNLNNTDMKLELDHLAALMKMAVAYKKKIGFKGQFFIEPKPKEPTKHQYDYDAAAAYAFLLENGLEKDFSLNLETNHATLAGHNMRHEMEWAVDRGMLGSMDANTGDLLLGWDTDEFLTDIYEATYCMMAILRNQGLRGGINFDARVRRESTDPEDLFHAHIGSMDAFARGLKIAYAIKEDGRMAAFRAARYASWDADLGKKIAAGTATLEECESYALNLGNTPEFNPSGRQEMLAKIINEYI
jgi:xylose isomerase